MNEEKYANILEVVDKKVFHAASGNYLFDMEKLEQFEIGPHYSSAEGSAVKGERIQIVLVHKARGSGSRLHTHPNEQFNFVLKGRFRFRVANVEGVAEPGQLIYIPANVEHYVVATEDQDGIYLAAKDTSYYVSGEAVDGKRTGPHFDPSYKPENEQS